MTRLLFWAVFFAIATALWAQTDPCFSASSDCTEWISFHGSPARSLIYRSHPLDVRNDRVTRGLIIIHDAGRNAPDFFRTALAAAFLANALDDTVIVAPHFASNDGRECRDTLAANEVSWPCNGDSWRSGGTSPSHENLASFDLTDRILDKLARKEVFPNLKAIVIAGHSAGGQFVNRYEMANQVHDALGVELSYVVSNPSSYAYVDSLRPYSEGGTCAAVDKWPYGLENRTGYTARIADDQLKKQLAARPTTYLLGEIDILPIGGFDASCSAMAQGLTRRARGEAFVNYVNSYFGAHHQAVIVPLCGHNARCMFTSEVSLPILFPK
jgi:hypothetical protein